MLDERDNEIIKELKLDARTPVSFIAEKLGISNTAVKKRIEKLEANGIISGYTVKVNDQLLGNKKGLLIIHSDMDHSTALIQRLLQNKDEIDLALYRSSGNGHMFYLVADSGKVESLCKKLSGNVKHTCPITFLERLV